MVIYLVWYPNCKSLPTLMCRVQVFRQKDGSFCPFALKYFSENHATVGTCLWFAPEYAGPRKEALLIQLEGNGSPLVFLKWTNNQTKMTPYCVKLQWILKILCERLVWILELPEKTQFPNVDSSSQSFVCPFWSCQVYLWFGVSKSLHVTASPSRNDVWNNFLTENSLIPMHDKKSYMMSKWSFNSRAKSIEFKF